MSGIINVAMLKIKHKVLPLFNHRFCLLWSYDLDMSKS